MRAWRQEGDRFRYVPPEAGVWDRLRTQLTLGQQFTGTVVWTPQPAAAGIGVDLDLPVGGFVDVLLLPSDPAKWPQEGTVTDFKIWWMDERPQIRLVPVDQRYRREDFLSWARHQHTPAADTFLTNS